MKHLVEMLQSVSLLIVQVKKLTLVKPVPPSVLSQPIPLDWFVSALQLMVTESPYLTTTLGGLSLMGQRARPPVEGISIAYGSNLQKFRGMSKVMSMFR